MEEYHRHNDEFIQILVTLAKSKLAEIDKALLGVVSEILYDFDRSLTIFPRKYGLPIPKTYHEKTMLIKKAIDELVDRVSRKRGRI